ncbi:MAG: hypothetical protein P8P99_14845, partial [Maricaulis sp.]|nr:hypothetical protein [Maricaulis sp.]
PIFPGKNAALDLCLRKHGSVMGIELKYLSKACFVEHEGENFRLKSQGAQDIRRYDTLKDVQRIEELIGHGRISPGGVLCISNDPAYWNGPMRTGTCDEDFALKESKELSGTMCWAAKTGPGTQKGREKPIALAGRYRANWKTFSKIEGHEFRYLWIEVTVGAVPPPAKDNSAPESTARRQFVERETHASKILGFIDRKGRQFCDDCLSNTLDIKPRQTVNLVCNKLQVERAIERDHRTCDSCGRTKIVNFTSP